MTTILVVDDDPDVARFVEMTLSFEGFDVALAADGEQAFTVIRQSLPDLVLLDVMMPRVDGIEVCRQLRADPATVNLPVILLTARSLTADKVIGLAAGADDYIVKPFDTLELIARVRSALRRNAEMRAVSPLTGLPGNHRIDNELARRVAAQEPFALCHFDLDHFKAFNDAYGFLRGDEVITLLANALRAGIRTVGTPVPFIGHIGGDDFVLVSSPEQAEAACRRTIEIFDSAVRGLHDQADVARGFLEVRDRQGISRRYPLVTVSVGVTQTGRRQFKDHREMVSVAAEMKAVAKAAQGSAIAVDRRSDSADSADSADPIDPVDPVDPVDLPA